MLTRRLNSPTVSNLRQGRRQVGLPVLSLGQARHHHRFLLVVNPQHGRGQALSGQGAARLKEGWEQPTVINTDKATSYGAAIAELKKDGKLAADVEHRRAKYLNNVVEADHGKLKQLIRPVRGFKRLKTAYAAIRSFEVMRALRKGQASAFNLTRDVRGEARLMERAFGVGADALTDAIQFINERLEIQAP